MLKKKVTNILNNNINIIALYFTVKEKIGQNTITLDVPVQRQNTNNVQLNWKP